MRFPGFEGEWSRINISELLDFQNGINANSDKYGSGIKYISVSDILNNPYICYDDIKGFVDIDNSTLEHYKVEYGDIVFQRSSETFEDIGHANVYLDKSHPATFGGFVIRGKKKGNYIPFFFKNLLDTPYARKATTRMGAGAQHYNIGQDGLSKISLYFPKINEQEKIADLFMILNKKIKLHKELIESLKLYKRGLLSKLFPKKGENVPLYRFEGFTYDWEQRKAKDLFVSTADKGHPELPVLSATQDRGMIRRDENSINIYHDKKNEEGYKRVLAGQFVIHLRSFQGGFAHSDIEGITSPAYTVFGFLEPEKHDSNYWKYVFTSQEFIRRLETITYGIRDGKSISYDEFLTMNFVYPTKEEQVKIAGNLNTLDHLIALHQEKYYSYNKIKSALLQQMFI